MSDFAIGNPRWLLENGHIRWGCTLRQWNPKTGRLGVEMECHVNPVTQPLWLHLEYIMTGRKRCVRWDDETQFRVRVKPVVFADTNNGDDFLREAETQSI